MRRSPSGASAASSGTRRPVSSNSSSGPVARASTPRARCRWPVVLARLGHRHLVRAPRVLDLLPVDLARPGPALGRAEDQHRPRGPLRLAVLARAPLDLGDAVERRVERSRERLVHGLGLVARHDHRVPAVAAEEREQLVLRDPREQRRVRDLVAVEVEDRQDRPVRRRVQELVRVPARRERPRLGLAVADDAQDEQVGVVERGAERVRERVAELAALVDRARASPARRGSGSRRGTRTGGRAGACRPRPARSRGRPRSTSPRGTCSRRGRGRRGRGRSRRSRSGRAP